MATIKKLQAEKDNGEWENLSEQAQQQVGVCMFITQLQCLLWEMYKSKKSSSYFKPTCHDHQSFLLEYTN